MNHLDSASQISSLFYRLSGASDDDKDTMVLDFGTGRTVYFQIDPDRYFGRPTPSPAVAFEWLKKCESDLRLEIARYLDEHVVMEWNLGASLDLCKFQESIVLHTAYLRGDSSWELYYEDGGTFGGQIVVAETDPQGCLRRIYLAA